VLWSPQRYCRSGSYDSGPKRFAWEWICLPAWTNSRLANGYRGWLTVGVGTGQTSRWTPLQIYGQDGHDEYITPLKAMLWGKCCDEANTILHWGKCWHQDVFHRKLQKTEAPGRVGLTGIASHTADQSDHTPAVPPGNYSRCWCLDIPNCRLNSHWSQQKAFHLAVAVKGDASAVHGNQCRGLTGSMWLRTGDSAMWVSGQHTSLAADIS